MAQQRFPDQFIWGVAAASYQIEGATREDGRGPSIWDTFSATPGNTLNGDTGEVACDHYHRYRDDLALMRELGTQGYRFSIAWPRILPQGTGAVNQKGLDFYDRLVDEMLRQGIKPFATLYHWDLPQALQDRGGWASRELVDAFVNYTEVVVRRLGDRVKHWITHNEPWVFSFVGHFWGAHAPGIKDLGTAIQVAHHLMLSHGRALPVIHRDAPGAQGGIALSLSPFYPAGGNPAHAEAVRRADGFINRWFLDPLYGRGYPQDMLALYGDLAPRMAPGDLAEIATPADFLGINYYAPTYVRPEPFEQNPLGYGATTPEEEAAAGREVTSMGWPVSAPSFLELLRTVKGYGPRAIYITENGAAFEDELTPDERIHDGRRLRYLHDHLRVVQAAIGEGIPVQGYFVWSFMDNYEWSLGYTKRFGIVYVDYASQRRILKDSALWYKRAIAARAVVSKGVRG